MAKNDKYSELCRVQVPAMLHLLKLGYTYIDKDERNSKGLDEYNILKDVLKSKFLEFNQGKTESDFKSFYQDVIDKSLTNNDLGKSFYEALIGKNGAKLIDFDNIDNNVFHATFELAYKRKGKEESFRPDITLFINGLPLVFAEFKLPNNKGGMYEEEKRLKERFANPENTPFFNLTQLMIFSNNQEYKFEKPSDRLLQGSFYCTYSSQPFFNLLREENPRGETLAPYYKDFKYFPVEQSQEDAVRGYPKIANFSASEEFTPVKKIFTSLCSRERLLFLIKYGIAYVKADGIDKDGETISEHQKHIMRYQQLFAALAVKERLFSDKVSENDKKGIIWHTQGSGKTALSYYLCNLLDDLYANEGISTRFYFIVDRLDLLNQASMEFRKRGLKVYNPKTASELKEDFCSLDRDGKSITVVNIHKFSNESIEFINPNDLKVQRVFIIDEAHRSYSQYLSDNNFSQGEFLKNLLSVDENAVKIALTGTPIIKAHHETREIFGNYIHTYLYNQSVADGYTLKIQRVEVDTKFEIEYKNLLDKFAKAKAEQDFNQSIEQAASDLLSGSQDYESDDEDSLSRFVEDDEESARNNSFSPSESTTMASVQQPRVFFGVPKVVPLIPNIRKDEGSKGNAFAVNSSSLANNSYQSNAEGKEKLKITVSDYEKHDSFENNALDNNNLDNNNLDNNSLDKEDSSLNQDFVVKEEDFNKEDAEQRKNKLIEDLKEFLRSGDLFNLPENLKHLEKSFFNHDKYIACLSKYIVRSFFAYRKDIENSEECGKDLGAMVICNTSKQARALQKRFALDVEEYLKEEGSKNLLFDDKDKKLKSAVILSDNGKDDCVTEINKFKKGKIDVLFVHSMLLTGFDCPRLKKLYICRRLRDHTLLQAITRVNRPYKNMESGSIEDIVNILPDYNKINDAYNKEFENIFENEIPGEVDFLSIFYANTEDTLSKLEEIITNDYYREDSDDFTSLMENKELKELERIRELFRTCLRNKTMLVNLEGKELSREGKNIVAFLNNMDEDKLKEYVKELNNRIFNLNYNNGKKEDNDCSLDDVMKSIEIQMEETGRVFLDHIQAEEVGKIKQSIEEKINALRELGDEKTIREIGQEFFKLLNEKDLDQNDYKAKLDGINKKAEDNYQIEQVRFKRCGSNKSLANIDRRINSDKDFRAKLSSCLNPESKSPSILELQNLWNIFCSRVIELHNNQSDPNEGVFNKAIFRDFNKEEQAAISLLKDAYFEDKRKNS